MAQGISSQAAILQSLTQQIGVQNIANEDVVRIFVGICVTNWQHMVQLIEYGKKQEQNHIPPPNSDIICDKVHKDFAVSKGGVKYLLKFLYW